MVLCVRAASPISVYLYPAHRICAPPAHACTAPHSQLPTALRPRHLLREVLPRRAHSGRAAAAHNRAAGSTRPRHSQPAHTNRPRTELGGLAPQGRIRRDGSGQLNTSLQRQIKRCSARVWAGAACSGCSSHLLLHRCINGFSDALVLPLLGTMGSNSVRTRPPPPQKRKARHVRRGHRHHHGDAYQACAMPRPIETAAAHCTGTRGAAARSSAARTSWSTPICPRPSGFNMRSHASLCSSLPAARNSFSMPVLTSWQFDAPGGGVGGGG